jgi:phage recombination protein Bet
MTTTALATAAPEFRLPMPAGVADLDAGRWRVLTEAIFPMARSAGSILLALDYCRARGLDVLKRPVNIVPVWNSELGRNVETIWPSIAEVEITAARTGLWAGMDRPVWGPTDTRTFRGEVKRKDSWVKVEQKVEFPEWCSITVYKIVDGAPRAFAEEVYWLEAYGRQGGTELPNAQWLKRPRGQLAKVAKAFALRAAFPEEGALTAEEMAGQMVETRPEPPEPKWTPPAPPAPAPPAETVDPDTGEITAAEPEPPNALPLAYLADGQIDWRAWGQSFIAAARSARTAAEIDQWLTQNDGALAEMKAAAPKMSKHLQAALDKHRADLDAMPSENGAT